MHWWNWTINNSNNSRSLWSFGINFSFHWSIWICEWIGKANFTNLFLIPILHLSTLLRSSSQHGGGWCMTDIRMKEKSYFAMVMACNNVSLESFQRWIHLSRRYVPHCLTTEDIACDVKWQAADFCFCNVEILGSFSFAFSNTIRKRCAITLTYVA